MSDEVQQQMIFSLPRTYLSYCHQTHKTISEFTTKLISHYEPFLSVVCTIWNVTSALSYSFLSFWIRSTSNLNFRRSKPIFHTYMIIINSIHLYIYNPESTVHGNNIIVNRSVFSRHVHKRDAIFAKHATCIRRRKATTAVNRFVLLRSSYYSVSSLNVCFFYITTIYWVISAYNVKVGYNCVMSLHDKKIRNLKVAFSSNSWICNKKVVKQLTVPYRNIFGLMPR